MARCKVIEVGVGLTEADRPEGPYVILSVATLDDLRMLGGALYDEVFVEPGATPSESPAQEKP